MHGTNTAASDTPLVSVIMPAYNASSTIAQSIESVRNQTYSNWELIVVNDFSSDETVGIVKKYLSDPRIKMTCNPKNRGPSYSRNQGITASGGEYIAFIDADDIWLPNKLKKQVAYHVLYPQYIVSHTDFVEFDQSGRSKRIWRHYIHSKHRKSGNLLPLLYYDNIIGLLTVMVQKTVFDNVGGFNERYFGSEDWELWIRLSKRGYEFGYIDEILAKYRINNYSVSKNNARYKKAIRKVLNESVLSDTMVSRSAKRKARATYYLMFGRMYYKNSNINMALRYYYLSFRHGYIDLAHSFARVIFFAQCLWKKIIRGTNRIGANTCVY